MLWLRRKEPVMVRHIMFF